MRLAIPLALCGLLAAGCSLLSGAGAADKAGGAGRTVTLRLAYTDQPGSPPGRAAKYFAARVRELSGGSVRVRILWQAGGWTAPRWELRVVDMVRNGEAELALAPARAWAQRGAASLDALMAPFLITSDGAARRVAAGPLTGDLLGGVKAAGAVGLAMVPAGLRHPFSFGDPLLMRADYAGAAIRAPYSDIGYDAWRAMGARPVDLSGRDVAKAAARGRVLAAESSYAFAGGLTQTSTATGNVTPFARIDVLAVSSDVFAELGSRTQAILRRAAAKMTRQGGATEAELAREFCDSGGRVVLAPAGEVRTLAAATAGATARLERDPLTRRLIAEIRSWRLSAEPAASCGGVRAARPALTGRSTSIHALDGVYRLAWSKAEMRRAGISENYALGNSGVITLTLHGGRYLYHQVDALDTPDCRGRYSLHGHTFRLDMNVGLCVGLLDATWSLKGDALWLTLRDAIRDDEIWWGTKPWRRIAR